MAYRQFQTAAARVIHVVEPTDGDMQRLTTEFHFHPLDLEAVLGVHPKPRLGSYRHYVTAAIPWPMLDRRGRHVMTSELQLFIGPNYLVVVEDGSQADIRDLVAEWAGQAVNADSPTMLAYELFNRLLKTTAATVRAVPAAQWKAALLPVTHGLERLRELVTEQGWLELEDSRHAYAYLLYSCKHLMDTVRHLPEPAAVRPVKRPALQSAVTGYAIASAIMTAIVLVIISFKR